jgi:hypothetical protein
LEYNAQSVVREVQDIHAEWNSFNIILQIILVLSGLFTSAIEFSGESSDILENAIDLEISLRRGDLANYKFLQAKMKELEQRMKITR